MSCYGKKVRENIELGVEDSNNVELDIFLGRLFQMREMMTKNWNTVLKLRKNFNQLFDSLSSLQVKHQKLENLLESDWKIFSDVNVMEAELAEFSGLGIELPFSTFLTTVSLDELEAYTLLIRINLITAIQKKFLVETEIQTLEEKSHSTSEFLAYIYGKFPPRHTLSCVRRPETVRKAVKEALRSYHPDKQSGIDLEWCLICSEISKHLSKKL